LALDPAPTQPVFNSQETEEKFDSENPEIQIPEPVVNEEDNDWVLSEFELEQLIMQYLEKKGQSITI